MDLISKAKLRILNKIAQQANKPQDWNYYLENSKDVRKKDVADGFQFFWPLFIIDYRNILDGTYASFKVFYQQLLLKKGKQKFTGEEIIKVYADAIKNGATNGFFIDKYPQFRGYSSFLKTTNSASFIEKEGKDLYIRNFTLALGWDLSSGKKVTPNQASQLWLNTSLNRFKQDAGGNTSNYQPNKVSP
jgi:hypothetical protein